MTWIQTRLGHRIDLLDPRPEDIDVEDIAYALRGINRFTGHSRITVAQHCIRVAAHLWQDGHGPRICLGGLCHDAPEAIYGDLSTPLKDMLWELLGPDEAGRLRRALRLIDCTVYASLGVALDGEEWQLVKSYDLRALYTEARVLGWDTTGWGDEPELLPPLDAPMVPWQLNYMSHDGWLVAYRFLKDLVGKSS